MFAVEVCKLTLICFFLRYLSAGYGKQVPVFFDVADDVGDAIITDEEWLWQMLLNLLTNACKYTEKGRIDVKISLRRDIDMDNERVMHDGETQRVNIPHLMIPTRIEPDMLLCEVMDTGELCVSAMCAYFCD